MKTKILIIALAVAIGSCKNETKKESTVANAESNEVATTTEQDTSRSFEIHPISHATMVLEWAGNVLYVDPVGGAEAFANQPEPNLIFITDIHGDHLNVETLEAIKTPNAKIIVPQAVADKLPESLNSQVVILNNGEIQEFMGFSVEAIPMYNLREEALKFHEKGPLIKSAIWNYKINITSL